MKKFKRIITAITFSGLLFLSVPVYANVAPTVPTEITDDEQTISNVDSETAETVSDTEQPTNTEETATDEANSETATDGEATNDETDVEITEEIEEEDLAGIAPDSGLYVLDRLLEDIQISLTFDDVNRAVLLATISEERLAEANYLVEKINSGEEVEGEEWTQLLDDVINDYKLKLESALESVEEVALDLNEEEMDTLDEVLQQIENSLSVDEEIIENDSEVQEVIDKALLVSSVVKDLDQEKAQELRDAGLGLGQISQVFALAEATGYDIDEVAALFTEQKMGYGQVASELGINTSELAKKKVEEKKQEKERSTYEETNNEDEIPLEDIIEEKQPKIINDMKNTAKENAVDNKIKDEKTLENNLQSVKQVESKVKTENNGTEKNIMTEEKVQEKSIEKNVPNEEKSAKEQEPSMDKNENSLKDENKAPENGKDQEKTDDAKTKEKNDKSQGKSK